MKAKVLTLLKTKAKDFGFTEDELKTVGDGIANALGENATDEEIATKVDAMLPVLKLMQSASNRSIERYKEQSKKEAEEKAKAEEEARKKKEEEEAKKKAENDEPEWFKTYRETTEKKLSEQNALIESMKAEKVNDGFLKSVKEQLKDIDENFYGVSLEGRTFATQEDADSFVSKVKTGWETFTKNNNIQKITKVVPPAGTKKEDEKPSEAVQARIDARNKENEGRQESAIRVSSPIKTSN